MSINHVLKIAKGVRARLEKRVGKGDTLASYCGIASGMIVTEARKAGIRGIRRMQADGHVFVKYGPWLVDVTAQQFDPKHPPIVAFKPAFDRQPEYWTPIPLRGHRRRVLQ